MYARTICLARRNIQDESLTVKVGPEESTIRDWRYDNANGTETF